MKIGNLKYSKQANLVMESLKDGTFNIEKFEEWVKNKFVVGGGYIVEYLEKLNKGELD